MLLEIIKANWKRCFWLITIIILYLFVTFKMLFYASYMAPILSEQVNLYWWTQMFENENLTLKQMFIHYNQIFILFTLSYIPFLIIFVTLLFQKNRTFLSLIFVMILSLITFTFGSMFIIANDYNQFQLAYLVLQKYSTIIFLGIFIFQFYSFLWKKKTTEIK